MTAVVTAAREEVEVTTLLLQDQAPPLRTTAIVEKLGQESS